MCSSPLGPWMDAWDTWHFGFVGCMVVRFGLPVHERVKKKMKQLFGGPGKNLQCGMIDLRTWQGSL